MIAALEKKTGIEPVAIHTLYRVQISLFIVLFFVFFYCFVFLGFFVLIISLLRYDIIVLSLIYKK